MTRNNLFTSTALAVSLGCAVPAFAGGLAVKITPDLDKVEVKHAGTAMTIQRNQDENNLVSAAFAKTSRKCPPFCIQPGTIAPGVDTIGELEVIHFLKKMSDGDTSILVVDSRTADWVEKGTIPGSVNIPWTSLREGQDGADAFTINDVLVNKFGAKEQGQGYDFSKAKTLVLFCNGMWCGQSPANIRTLLKMGYPAERIKWYRGGMQDWEMLGLTTVKPAPIK